MTNKKIVGTCIILAGAPLVMVGSLLGLFGDGAEATASCSTSNPASLAQTAQVAVATLTPVQNANATLIKNVGLTRHLSNNVIVSGIITAKVESNLMNINFGDKGSLGLFQQRPSMGWGTPQQVMQPVYATNKYFSVAQNVSGHDIIPPGKLAQDVQRSQFPDRYAVQIPVALQVMGISSLSTAAAHQSQSASVQQVSAPCTTSQAVSVAATFGGAVIWPVTKAGSSVSSCFGPRVLNGVAGFHPGVDIAQPIGTPVFAAAGGSVSFAGPVSGYGNNYVTILHGGHIATGYGHMNAMSVKLGQLVAQGQQIGVVGNQGASFGPHLHFNVIDLTKPHDLFNGNVDPLKNGLTIPAGVPNPNGCS